MLHAHSSKEATEEQLHELACQIATYAEQENSTSKESIQTEIFQNSTSKHKYEIHMSRPGICRHKKLTQCWVNSIM